MNQYYVKDFKRGEVLFSENTIGTTMYYIQSGVVGIFKNYGKENQIKLAELDDGAFGEMAIADEGLRTATAVVLKDACIQVIEKDEMEAYFENNPFMKEELLKTVSERIRSLNREYMRVCGCISEYMKAEENGTPKSDLLIKQMRKIAANVDRLA